ncbi:MAG: CoA-binding protein [Gemmatimonadota bacterium]
MTDDVERDADAEDWRDNLVEDAAEAVRLLGEARRIAVLGIKAEDRAGQPAYYVPEYLKKAGYEIVPVPVYYPDREEILEETCCFKVADVPGELDMVVVFRKPKDIPPHVDDLIAARPKVVWFQLGIRNDAAAERLARAGIKVVQDRCTMVDHRLV